MSDVFVLAKMVDRINPNGFFLCIFIKARCINGVRNETVDCTLDAIFEERLLESLNAILKELKFRFRTDDVNLLKDGPCGSNAKTFAFGYACKK